MQKKLNSFLRKEIEKFKDNKYIEGLTFEQLKKISSKEDDFYLN
jgi:cell division protein FtsB